MAQRRIVQGVALAMGLVFLTLFFITSGSLAASPAKTGPLHTLSHFFNPGLKADPAQYLIGHLVRVALGILALGWLTIAVISRATADATVRAILRPGFHRQRALLALVLGGHVVGLGGLQLFLAHGGPPKWLGEVYALGVIGFFLNLVPRALGLLVCIRLLFGRHRAAYDYHLGMFAALGALIALVPDLKHLINGIGGIPAVDLVLRLIGALLFPVLAIWTGIILARATLPLPGRIQGGRFIAYTVAGGIIGCIALGDLFHIPSIFRYAPSVAWVDSVVALAFLTVVSFSLLHAAAMAMAPAAAPSSPSVEFEPEAPPAEPLPVRHVPSRGFIVDAVLGFVISGMLFWLTLFALSRLPLGLVVYMPIGGIATIGGWGVVLVGILIRRFGYVLGATLFVLGFSLLVAR